MEQDPFSLEQVVELQIYVLPVSKHYTTYTLM